MKRINEVLDTTVLAYEKQLDALFADQALDIETDIEVLKTMMKKEGLVGIEAMYSTHSAEDEEYVRKLSSEEGLLISGGSDYHGINKPGIELGTGCGNLNIPEEVWYELRKR